jgi:anti-sigma factor RsiW
MALVECPDCGRKVSDKAEACPACAHPVAGWKEAGEAKGIAVGAGVAPSRARENRPAARLVVLETPVATPTAATPAPPAERTAAPTYRYVCHLCGEDEVLLYRPPQTDQHVCGACEEDALVSGVERRRLLQWWPVAFVLLLLVGGAFLYRCVPL